MKFVFLLSALIFVGSEHVQAQGIAVIELFTSQGCSSCPAADKNLTQILKDAEQNDKQIYGLSFHVDYWNHIGWKDPYSNKDYTARQRDYWRDLNFSSIYTPQMIVNGQSEFVGSDRSTAEQKITDALHQPTLYLFKTFDIVATKDGVHITYELDKAPSNNEVLNFAFVQKKAQNLVTAGENSGKNLIHDNVVRAFRSVTLEEKGNVEFKFQGFNVSKTLLIAFVQDKQRKVVAATSKSLSN